MMTTFFAPFEIMKRASLGPWTESSGTTRQNPPIRSLPFVSDERVADGEIAASFAAVNVGPAATTPPDVAGPISAMTDESETYFCASDEYRAGSSWPSPS